MTQDAPASRLDGLDRRLRRTALACTLFAAGMVGLAYAAVPLYDLFCRITGFQGTPVVRATQADAVVDHPVRVLFDANVAPGLPWRFKAETPEVIVKAGETTTVHYRITNAGSSPATGIASYNVQPALAGGYFVKMQCFCFTEQILQPGETMASAVVFYVDPAIVRDPSASELRTITLSYTFFSARGGTPMAATAASVRPNMPQAP